MSLHRKSCVYIVVAYMLSSCTVHLNTKFDCKHTIEKTDYMLHVFSTCLEVSEIAFLLPVWILLLYRY